MRPSVESTWLNVARVIAERGTCARRKVGCVLVDSRGLVVATGYNGVASGLPHCTDVPCGGAAFPSGVGLSKCGAIHAEQNALMQCKNVWEIKTCYVTVSPCIHCVKMLMNTSCVNIIFLEEYAHNDEARDMWPFAWVHYDPKVHPKEFGNIKW